MAATMRLNSQNKTKQKAEMVCTENIFFRSKYDTHNLKRADRAKDDVKWTEFTQKPVL
jgi:hypothetical protein